MTVVIDYFSPSSEALRSGMPGIYVAIEDFLKAWFLHGNQSPFICRAEDQHSFERFKQLAQAVGVDPDQKCVGLDPRTPRHNLESISCLFRPDPAMAGMLWRRNQLSGPGYAACGLAHTLSGEQVARAMFDSLIAPATSADALICPSTAIRDAALKIWEGQAAYLEGRFGGNARCPIQTPVIPLGIDTARFSSLSTPDKRKRQREALGIKDDEIAVLFVGRLSFVTKAHPLPLFLAMEQAARCAKRKLRLVLYGYFMPQQDMELRFHALAKDYCQNVLCDFVQNTDPRFPDGLWAAADIFTSLADNIQESFGLTPIEAMACGLPAVVTDWNGYRDGLSHGQEGFLVPTCSPPADAGDELADQYFNENNYGVLLASASQSTSADIPAAAAAFAALAENGDLRRKMGANGRLRAQNVYDWRVIIPAYQALWRELAARRQKDISAQGSGKGKKAHHPAHPNPWNIFSGFPSSVLSHNDVLRVVMTNEEISLILTHAMNLMIPELLPPVSLLREMIEAMRRAGRVRAGDVIAAAEPPNRAALWRSLGWMLKQGVCVREAA